MADGVAIAVTDLRGAPFVGISAVVTTTGGPYTHLEGFRRYPGGEAAGRSCGPMIPVTANPQTAQLASAGQQDQPGNQFWAVRAYAFYGPQYDVVSVTNDGTGHAVVRTAAAHGLTSGDPVTLGGQTPDLYAQSWQASVVDATHYQLVGLASYAGDALGGWWAPGAEARRTVDSPEVFACASVAHYSLHSRVIDSIQRRLVAMNLPGVGEHVFTKKGFEVNAAKRYPAIVLSLDDEQERDMGGTVLCDDWGFPVKAQIVDQKHSAPVLDENYLYWRERIRSLHPRRLDDVPGSMKTLFEPRWLIQYRQDQLLYYTSLAILRCVVRAGRT